MHWLESHKSSKISTSILGTSPRSIDQAEDRELFEKILTDLQITQPKNGIARTKQEAILIANRIKYPVVVRPSFVLGGAFMAIVYNDDESILPFSKNLIRFKPP